MATIDHVPRVYLERALRTPEPVFETGVPAFLGLGPISAEAQDLLAGAGTGVSGVARLDVASFAQLDARLGPAWGGSYLGYAVRGFFENGGQRCYVAHHPSIAASIDALDAIDDIDLACAPDLAGLADRQEMVAGQAAIVSFCGARAGCFAILDGPGSPAPSLTIDLDGAIAHRDALVTTLGPAGMDAALYAPWIKVQDGGLVPPCGHVAGVYARVDRSAGVHAAPANQAIEGAVDLQLPIDDAQQSRLQPLGVNALRAFPGRGIRVWGARTLSADEAWRYVGVRRLVRTIARWLEAAGAGLVFEPNDLRLWARIGRDVGTFLAGLYRRGALAGSTPEEAYFVRCDAETNPPEARAAGKVIVEVGVAPVLPSEFLIVRLVGDAEGASVSTP